MMFRRWMIAAWVATSVSLAAGSAAALVAIPQGFPDGPATDMLTVNGVYATPLPMPLAQPFAAADFTLVLTVPARVTVSAAGPVVSEFYLPVTGSYSNGGQTETFTNAIADFGATNTALPGTAEHFTLIVPALLIPHDSFSVTFQAGGPLFSPAIFVAGTPETFTFGTLSVGGAEAAYGTDPAFTGTVSLSPSAAVPEPATWAMLLAGLSGLGAILRARPRSGYAPA